MTQRDEAIKLPNGNGIHKLRLKIDAGAHPTSFYIPLNVSRKTGADGFPNIKKQFIYKKLIAFNGTPIKCFGNIKIPCQYNKSDLASPHLPHCRRIRARSTSATIAGTAQTNYPSLYSQERRCVPNSCSNTD